MHHMNMFLQKSYETDYGLVICKSASFSISFDDVFLDHNLSRSCDEQTVRLFLSNPYQVQFFSHVCTDTSLILVDQKKSVLPKDNSAKEGFKARSTDSAKMLHYYTWHFPDKERSDI